MRPLRSCGGRPCAPLRAGVSRDHLEGCAESRTVGCPPLLNQFWTDGLHCPSVSAGGQGLCFEGFRRGRPWWAFAFLCFEPLGRTLPPWPRRWGH